MLDRAPAQNAARATAHEIASARTAARVTGIWYLSLAIAGMLSFLVVRPQIFAEGDAAATLANLVDKESLARLGLVAEMGVVLAQALTAIWFYKLFRDINHVAAWALAMPASALVTPARAVPTPARALPTPARVAAAWLRTPSAVTVAMTAPRPTAWPSSYRTDPMVPPTWALTSTCWAGSRVPVIWTPAWISPIATVAMSVEASTSGAASAPSPSAGGSSPPHAAKATRKTSAKRESEWRPVEAARREGVFIVDIGGG